MDATFLQRIKSDFPDARFCNGKKFAFRFPRTIVIGPDEPHDWMLLLHELGHMLCGHNSFNMDVERLKMECEAWERARELAQYYGLAFDNSLAEDELDTYRDWLHEKSRCPRCGLTRFQTPDKAYHCPKCDLF